jgi:type I restriction enzyme S subunit
MRDLETRRLGDLISLQRGISWDATQERDQPGEGTWPVLGIPNVQERLVLDRLVHLKIPGGKPAAARLASLGTILMVGSNGNPARVGNAVYIDRDDGFLFASFLIGARKRDTADADPKFLFHFIASPAVQDALTRSVRGTTGLQNLSQKFVEGIRVPTPPLPEQRQVATILDTLDDAIRKTEQIIAKLKQVKQGLLHDLLTCGIDDNGELRDPARHPEQFKDSPLGRIPNDWRCTTVGELLAERVLIAVQDGNHGEAHPKRDDFVAEGIPFVMANNLRDGQVDAASCYKITRRQYESLRVGFSVPGDVLLSHKGTMGETACVDERLKEIVLTPQVTYYRPNSAALHGGYLFWWLNGPAFQRQLAALSVQSTRAFLSITGQRQLRVAVPPLPEQPWIANRLSVLNDQLVAEQSSIAKLRLLKQGLMGDLLTGRVRVTTLLEPSAP